MTDYNNVLDVIITSQLLQKKRNNILKMNASIDKQFNNILNQSIEKLQKGDNRNGLVRQLTAPLTAPYAARSFKGSVETTDKFDEALNFVLKHEGKRFVYRDGASGESSMYGILQSTAREYGYKGNIKDINIEDVKAIYRKIWDKSGASSLPPGMSVVHFDTYVNSPAMAKKLLNRSNGDINTYLTMREQRYVSLSEKRPDVFKKYLNGWKNRVENLRTMVANIDGINTTRHA